MQPGLRHWIEVQREAPDLLSRLVIRTKRSRVMGARFFVPISNLHSMEIFQKNRDDFKETLAFKTEFPICISNTNFTLTKFKFYTTNIS
jgi:hypothetical protein